MKKILFPLVAVAVLGFVACSDDKDNNPTPPPGNNTSDTLRGDISADRTLEAGHVYYIDGAVFVTGNAKLTVKPGVVVKGIKKTGEGNGSVLVVTRGAQLIADGTAAQPIVFTSAEAKGSRQHGDWGGIVLLGKASVNSKINGVPGRQVEGFTAAAGKELGDKIIGGGTVDNDNSGIVRYVRIEFAGIPLSNTPNSELNSLTMIGVGSGTTIDYVQSSFGGDDGFEWFGGTVNAKHLISYRSLDDDFDTDNGFTGKVQFGVSIRDKELSDYALSGGASNGFESDNDADGSDNTPFTAPVFSNITIIGPWAINDGANIPAISAGAFLRGAHIRRNSRLSVFNSVFVGFPTGIYLESEKTGGAATAGTLAIGNTLVGVTTVKKVDSKTVGTLAIGSWFMTTAFANDTTYNTAADFKFAKVSGLTDLSQIDARPVAGSPLLNKASFTNAKLNDPFITKTVTYAGAFDVNDTWATGWTNWDPKNATY